MTCSDSRASYCDPVSFKWWLRPSSEAPRRGFTLVELLIVLAVMAVLAGLVLPSMQPGVYEQLLSAARIVRSDLAYAQSLAVAYGNRAQVRFELNNNRYILELRNGEGAAQALPDTAFRDAANPNQYVIDLDHLPLMGVPVQLAKVVSEGGAATTQIVFEPLGNATGGTVWLTAGSGQAQRWMAVTIDATTGLADIGSFVAQSP